VIDRDDCPQALEFSRERGQTLGITECQNRER